MPVCNFNYSKNGTDHTLGTFHFDLFVLLCVIWPILLSLPLSGYTNVTSLWYAL